VIIIAEPYARYAPTLAESELAGAAERLFLVAERTAQDHYGARYLQFGLAITVRIEVGSTRVWITVVAASVFNVFINYGSVRQSLDYLIKDAQTMAGLLLPHVPESLGIAPQQPELHQRRLGLPGKLRTLFARVESGELSAEEATAKASELIEKHGLTAVEEITKLKQQLTLDFQTNVRPTPPQLRERISLNLAESTSHEALPLTLPSSPNVREPVVAVPPGSKRRSRRKGVVAQRDRETGNIQIIPR
jgi:hypothetical protein